MSKHAKAANHVDALGLLCPLPVLRARKLLQSMAPGEVLHVSADDPMAAIDLPNFCREQGHILLEADGTEFLIRKGPTT